MKKEKKLCWKNAGSYINGVINENLLKHYEYFSYMGRYNKFLYLYGIKETKEINPRYLCASNPSYVVESLAAKCNSYRIALPVKQGGL